MSGSTTTRQHLLEINQGDAERGNAGRRRREKRPKEPWKGDCVKSIVYADLDAIVTCFSLISSIKAGNSPQWMCWCWVLLISSRIAFRWSSGTTSSRRRRRISRPRRGH